MITPMPETQVSPFSVRSPRLLARCWEADDADAFRALLDRNDRYLRPFIPWMRDEPQSLEQTRARLLGYRERFVAGEDFRYALFADGTLIGEVMLSPRSGPGTREVGYLLDRSATGHGYATEAAAMACRAAFDFAMVKRVHLHCSPENTASVRVAQKLGFTLLEVHEKCYEDSEGVLRDSMHWMLDTDLYLRSPAAHLLVDAFDAGGRPRHLPAHKAL
jgi:ribosomal-protein-serine acetyltransferase